MDIGQHCGWVRSSGNDHRKQTTAAMLYSIVEDGVPFESQLVGRTSHNGTSIVCKRDGSESPAGDCGNCLTGNVILSH